MANYLLDCNHLSVAIRVISPLRERLRRERQVGNRFIACHPALCELEAGIEQTAAPEEYRDRLRQVLGQIKIWPLDFETTRIYGKLFVELRRKGRVLSQVDLILASLARQYKLKLLTSDRDFEALPDLRVENWID